MFHVRSPCSLAGNDHLDEWIHRVEHRRRDSSFMGTHFHGSHFALMTGHLRSQLERTRQPGYAQADASWCTPVGVATNAGNAGILLDAGMSMNGLDSGSRTTTGAAAGLGERAP